MKQGLQWVSACQEGSTEAPAAAALPALQGAAHPPGACALRARVAQPAAVPSVGPRSKARGLGFVFV